MNKEEHMDTERLTTPWWALRVGLGGIAFLAGLDKYFNLLADWSGYLSPLTTGHFFDIAVRDVAMAIAGFTLARLTEAGVGVEAHAASHVRDPLVRTV